MHPWSCGGPAMYPHVKLYWASHVYIYEVCWSSHVHIPMWSYAGPAMYTCEAMLTSHAHIYEAVVAHRCTHAWSHAFLALLPIICQEYSHKLSTLRQTYFSCPTPKLPRHSPSRKPNEEQKAGNCHQSKEMKSGLLAHSSNSSSWAKAGRLQIGAMLGYKTRPCERGRRKRGRKEWKKKSCEICVCTWRKCNTVVIVTGTLGTGVV